MNAACSNFLSTVRRGWRSVFLAPLGAALLALAACNGTAVVTMTSTASTDNFLAYRVELVSVQLQTASGGSSLTILPASTIVDFATLTNMDEVLGAAQISKGTYTSAVVTLDFSSAQIIYDNGSLNGVSLTPVNANGQTLGLYQITVTLDPNDSFSVAPKGASLLAINFNLAASNLVDLNNNTVVVTPLIAASSLPIDSKQVRIRGPLQNVTNPGTAATSSASFTMGAMPFNSTTNGGGTLSIVPTAATTYEINGTATIGGTGVTQLAALSSGSLAIAYGTLTATDETSTTTQTTTAEGTLEDNIATSTNVTFTATQVLAGSSVQGAGLDRVTGVVTARSGNTLELQDATLVGADGTDTFILGTTQVTIGAEHRNHRIWADRRGLYPGAGIRGFLHRCLRHTHRPIFGKCHHGCQRRARAPGRGLGVGPGYGAGFRHSDPQPRRARGKDGGGDGALRFHRVGRDVGRPVRGQHRFLGSVEFDGGGAGPGDGVDQFVRRGSAEFHRDDLARSDHDQCGIGARLERRDDHAVRRLQWHRDRRRYRQRRHRPAARDPGRRPADQSHRTVLGPTDRSQYHDHDDDHDAERGIHHRPFREFDHRELR